MTIAGISREKRRGRLRITAIQSGKGLKKIHPEYSMNMFWHVSFSKV